MTRAVRTPNVYQLTTALNANVSTASKAIHTSSATDCKVVAQTLNVTHMRLVSMVNAAHHVTVDHLQCATLIIIGPSANAHKDTLVIRRSAVHNQPTRVNQVHAVSMHCVSWIVVIQSVSAQKDSLEIHSKIAFPKVMNAVQIHVDPTVVVVCTVINHLVSVFLNSKVHHHQFRVLDPKIRVTHLHAVPILSAQFLEMASLNASAYRVILKVLTRFGDVLNQRIHVNQILVALELFAILRTILFVIVQNQLPAIHSDNVLSLLLHLSCVDQAHVVAMPIVMLVMLVRLATADLDTLAIRTPDVGKCHAMLVSQIHVDQVHSVLSHPMVTACAGVQMVWVVILPVKPVVMDLSVVSMMIVPVIKPAWVIVVAILVPVHAASMPDAKWSYIIQSAIVAMV